MSITPSLIALTQQRAAELHGAPIKQQKTQEGKMTGWAQGTIHVIDMGDGQYSVSVRFPGEENQLTINDLTRMTKEQGHFLLPLSNRR